MVCSLVFVAVLQLLGSTAIPLPNVTGIDNKLLSVRSAPFSLVDQVTLMQHKQAA